MQFIGNAKISKGDSGVSLCFDRPLEEQDHTCYLSRIPVHDSYITIVTTLRGTPVEVNFPDEDLVLPDQALLQFTAHQHIICWLHALLGTDAVKQIAAGEETFTLILDALDRPAEFYVQRPDRTIAANSRCGVEVRLTGVSRSNRTAKQFHEALRSLDSLVKRTAYEALTDAEQSIQTFVVMMLDDEVETAPGSGIYSCVLEAEPSWQTKGE